MQEGKEGSAKKASRKGNRQDEGQFIGIGKKISTFISTCLGAYVEYDNLSIDPQQH